MFRSLTTTTVSNGPSLRLTLGITSCVIGDDMTSNIFNINDLVKVCVKVKCKEYINLFNISISTMKHELAKDDAICMNVTCNALKYSKKSACFDNWTDWNIGDVWGCKMHSKNDLIYLALLEIFIIANKCTKPEFSKLYKDSDFTDFTLSTPDGNVAVHKACLAAHSPVFKTMLMGQWKENNENLIELKGFSLQTVQHLKDYMYLGTLPDDGLRPLIDLAGLYSMDDLKKHCIAKLVEIVTPEDLYALHEYACERNLPELSYTLAQLTLDSVMEQSYQMRNKKPEANEQNEEN